MVEAKQALKDMASGVNYVPSQENPTSQELGRLSETARLNTE
jgi:hypothetical protein